MANTTVVYFDGTKEDKITRILRVVTPKRYTFFVSSFENGIATIDLLCDSIFTDVADIILGCFNNDSNFKAQLFKAFGCNKDTPFSGIKVNFNDVSILFTKKNVMYQELTEVTAKKHLLEDVLSVDKFTDLLFKDAESAKSWDLWVENCSQLGLYYIGSAQFARHWAKYMQYLMKKYNKTVAEIANIAYYACDMHLITKMMQCFVIDALVKYWKYGEELREFYKK